MSFILDALRKAERERPPGPVPDLFTVHGPQPPSPRWPARAIVVAALLLSVPAIALWAWVEGRLDDGPARPPAAVSPRSGDEVPPAASTPLPVAAPLPPALARPTPAVRRAVGERSPVQAPPAPAPAPRAVAVSPVPTEVPHVVEVPLPVPAPAPIPTPALAPTPAPAPAAPQSTASLPGGSAPADLQTASKTAVEALSVPIPASETPAGGVPAAVPLPALQPAPQPSPVSTSATVVEEAPPADGQVLELSALPEPVRVALPRLVVSGHVWSEEPSLRLLSVDDRVLREGGEAAPGVSLREITPAGAVFVFKGWHFRVTGGRP